jgi:hypothetical protein
VNVDDVEQPLAKYRPVAPPNELRRRVLDSADSAGPGRPTAIRDWLPAVAAVLVATLFYWLAAGERARIASRVPASAAVTSAAPPPEPWP